MINGPTKEDDQSDPADDFVTINNADAVAVDDSKEAKHTSSIPAATDAPIITPSQKTVELTPPSSAIVPKDTAAIRRSIAALPPNPTVSTASISSARNTPSQPSGCWQPLAYGFRHLWSKIVDNCNPETKPSVAFTEEQKNLLTKRLV